MRKARELNSFKDLRKFKIPKFYKDLGVEAMWAYVRQHYFCKDSTKHWHYDYNGLRYWFWERVKEYRDLEILEHLKNKGMIIEHDLWCYSFNKPRHPRRY